MTVQNQKSVNQCSQRCDIRPPPQEKKEREKKQKKPREVKENTVSVRPPQQPPPRVETCTGSAFGVRVSKTPTGVGRGGGGLWLRQSVLTVYNRHSWRSTLSRAARLTSLSVVRGT